LICALELSEPYHWREHKGEYATCADCSSDREIIASACNVLDGLDAALRAEPS